MVVIQVKRTEDDTFMYECSVRDSNDAVVRAICNIHNLRDKITRLAGACEELVKHGPAKAEADRGLDEIQEKDGKKIERGSNYREDPLGNRTGNAPSAQLCEVILKTCADAKAACAKDLSSRGVAFTVAGLQEKVDTVRGAVTMAYPGGLPAWDIVRQLVEDTGSADGVLAEVMGGEFMDPATATLWWAGKEFFRDTTVGDRIGSNEKTKVVARLQRKGGGPPMREPAVSEAERAAMMAFYFKKQEEAKALAENDEDAHLNAKWADPKALKRDLLGAGNIGWKGSR